MALIRDEKLPPELRDDDDRDRPRGGRPALPDDERRSKIVGVRFSPAELATIQARAESAGLTPAAWIRAAALRKQVKTVPEINRKIAGIIGKMGGNLNSIAARLRAAGDEAGGLTPAESEQIEKIRAMLVKIQEKLR